MNYSDIVNRLSACYDRHEAQAVSRLVLEECFGMSMTDICCGKVTQLSREDNEKLEKIIFRLENSEPVQYVLGSTMFCGREFHVEPGVLIPRPETEELVDRATQTATVEMDTCDHQLRILDIGTGSGCIAISILLNLNDLSSTGKGVKMEAWDISEEALRIARANAERLGADVDFARHDILKESHEPTQADLTDGTSNSSGHEPHETDGSSITQKTETYDIIVSNPPYICHAEAAEMDANVLRHEPHLALFVPDSEPLLFYRAIATYAIAHLTPGGKLFFEINRAYAKETAALLEATGFRSVDIRNDLYGNPRMIKAEKPDN